MGRRFWEQLLEKAAAQTRLHADRSPGKENWMGAGAGRSGMGFTYVIRNGEASVEFYIQRGTKRADWNKAVFDELQRHATEIGEAFGEPLDWQRLDGKAMCRIEKRFDLGGLRDEQKWPEIQDTLIDAMIRLEKAFRPHIDALTV